eukprot:6180485-Pleurochrysis_carterae.AAC.13
MRERACERGSVTASVRASERTCERTCVMRACEHPGKESRVLACVLLDSVLACRRRCCVQYRCSAREQARPCAQGLLSPGARSAGACVLRACMRA